MSPNEIMSAMLFVGADNSTGIVDRDRIAAIVAKSEPGFTAWQANGFWQGASEDSEVILISDTRDAINATAETLREELHQDAVGIVYSAPMTFATAARPTVAPDPIVAGVNFHAAVVARAAVAPAHRVTIDHTAADALDTGAHAAFCDDCSWRGDWHHQDPGAVDSLDAAGADAEQHAADSQKTAAVGTVPAVSDAGYLFWTALQSHYDTAGLRPGDTSDWDRVTDAFILAFVATVPVPEWA